MSEEFHRFFARVLKRAASEKPVQGGSPVRKQTSLLFATLVGYGHTWEILITIRTLQNSLELFSKQLD